MMEEKEKNHRQELEEKEKNHRQELEEKEKNHRQELEEKDKTIEELKLIVRNLKDQINRMKISDLLKGFN